MIMPPMLLDPRNANLKRWFIATGGLGVVVAIVLAVAMSNDYVSSSLLVLFWPAAMVQLIDPQTIGSTIAVALIAYGSNFLIYGLIGAGIGFISSRLFRSAKQ
jgi:hypothetical protein